MAASSGSKNQKIGSNSKLGDDRRLYWVRFPKAQSQATIEKVSKRGRHARLAQKKGPPEGGPHVLRWVSLLRALRRSELYARP